MGEDEDEDSDSRSPKKRKMKQAKGVKRSASSASMRVVKGAAKTIKKSVSAQLLNARQAVSSRRVLTTKKAVKTSMLKTYGKTQSKLSSRNSSVTIVARDSSSESVKGKGRVGRPRKSIAKNAVRSMKGGRPGLASRASSSEDTIRVISVAGEE